MGYLVGGWIIIAVPYFCWVTMKAIASRRSDDVEQSSREERYTKYCWLWAVGLGIIFLADKINIHPVIVGVLLGVYAITVIVIMMKGKTS